jgi:hypothetical protein
MTIPIYAGKEHELIIEEYLHLVETFVLEVSSKSKYKSGSFRNYNGIPQRLWRYKEFI